MTTYQWSVGTISFKGNLVGGIVEPRFNELLDNEILGITNDIFLAWVKIVMLNILLLNVLRAPWLVNLIKKKTVIVPVNSRSASRYGKTTTRKDKELLVG